VKVLFMAVPVNNWSNPDNTGTITGTGSHMFPSEVLSAGVAIQSWSVSYGEGGDNHVEVMAVKIINTQYSGNTVNFQASITLTDSSKNKIKDASLDALISVCCS
jgi:hypothetical protein